MDAGRGRSGSGRSASRRSASCGSRSSTRSSARTPTRCRDPLEAGMGWLVKADKPDFIGRDAALATLADAAPRPGPDRASRSSGRDVPPEGAAIVRDGAADRARDERQVEPDARPTRSASPGWPRRTPRDGAPHHDPPGRRAATATTIAGRVRHAAVLRPRRRAAARHDAAGLPRPVRRSPLEAVHAAPRRPLGRRDRALAGVVRGRRRRGARPSRTAPGSPSSGRTTRPSCAGRERGEALAAAGHARRSSASSSRAADGVEAWCLADDEAIVRCRRRRAPDARAGASELARRLARAAAAVTRRELGLHVLRLVGPAAARDPGACLPGRPRRLARSPTGAIVQAPVVGVRIVVARQDHGGVPGFTLLVARDEAEYVWDALLDLGRDLGLVARSARSAVTAEPR